MPGSKNVQIALVGRQPGGAIQGLRIPPPIDHLILLHSSHEESRAAALKVKAVAAEMLSQGEVELTVIDPFGMNDVIAKITSIARDHADWRLTVNLSGGTNIMASAALVACFMVGADAIFILEDKGEIRRPLDMRLIRLPVPRVALKELKGPQARILRFLQETGQGTVERANLEVANRLGMTQQLASYHLRRLARWKLIDVQTVGRQKNVALTDTGLLFARMLSDGSEDSRLATRSKGR